MAEINGEGYSANMVNLGEQENFICMKGLTSKDLSDSVDLKDVSVKLAQREDAWRTLRNESCTTGKHFIRCQQYYKQYNSD